MGFETDRIEKAYKFTEYLNYFPMGFETLIYTLVVYIFHWFELFPYGIWNLGNYFGDIENL